MKLKSYEQQPLEVNIQRKDDKDYKEMIKEYKNEIRYLKQIVAKPP